MLILLDRLTNSAFYSQASGRRGLYGAFFPKLKKIKIQLENHTAIDFLRNLDPDFCARLKELAIQTKMVDEHEKIKYGNEMTRCLSKFKSLKSLHLI